METPGVSAGKRCRLFNSSRTSLLRSGRNHYLCPKITKAQGTHLSPPAGGNGAASRFPCATDIPLIRTMQYNISSPTRLQATIQLPASKSISNRALILHALAHGQIVPQNLSDCDDTEVMIRALSDMPEVIDIKAAGTAMRFLTAYLSVTPGRHVITGTQRMRQRPISILVNALRELGAQIQYVEQEGFPPLQIEGGMLQGSEVSLSGSVSSQYISALLMIGAVLPKGLLLHLTGEIVSRPYINLTLQLMRNFGAQADWTTERSIQVCPGGYRDTPFLVENDWSAASYWYEMAAIGSEENGKTEILLPGLFAHSDQGDSKGTEIFAKLGVHTEYTEQGIRLSKRGVRADRIEEDLLHMPDLAQTFVVTCCLLGIPFRFTGLQSLKIKETDRILALITELRKLGYIVRNENDCALAWQGERCTADPQAAIATYEDHRMAMAFAPAALVFPQVRIADPQVVSKSYPHYWEDLRKAGFSLKEEE